MRAHEPPEPCAGRGVLTTAYGHRRYRELAVTLARSLELYCPDIPRAVVTDADDLRLERLYSARIPLRQEWGSGLAQKLRLLDYSPFEQTLFIDSDALVVGSLDLGWELVQGHPVAAVGKHWRREGFWFGDIAERCERFDLPAVPVFNGGIYYFEHGDSARRIFSDARLLAARYDAHGFRRMGNGSINDEVVLSIAIARNAGGAIVDDKGRLMRTPIGISGALDVDVLRGGCRFVKEGSVVEPAIIHFCGSWASGFHYRRERAKLSLIAARIPRSIVGRAVDVAWNPPYSVYRAVHRASRPRRGWPARTLRRRLTHSE